MPEKKSEYSLLITILLVAIFLCLAIIGSNVIISWPRSIPADAYIHGSSSGYGSMFYIDGVRPENLSEPHYVQNGTLSGTCYFSAESDTPADGSCLILAIVDYNLTPLDYNGSRDTNYLVRYRTPVSRNVSYELAGLREGFHDVVFFVISDPYFELTYGDNDYYRPEAEMYGARFNVIVGNATKPEIPYDAGPLEPYVTCQNGSPYNLMGYGPWVTKVPCADMFTIRNAPSDNVTKSMTVSPGEQLDYYINVKNGAGDTNERFGRFALLQLLDYNQVPLRQDTPGNVYYGTLSPDQVMALHASIKAPETPGTHVLSFFLDAYPDENNSVEHNTYGYTGITSIIMDVKG